MRDIRSLCRRYLIFTFLLVLLYMAVLMVRMTIHTPDSAKKEISFIKDLYSATLGVRSPSHKQENLKCKKKTNVAFLKVHKAGSTTVMNIFIRFALQNDLNIVLPKNSSGYGFNYLGYGKTVDKNKIVPLPGNETYNILCNHVVYDKKAFDSIMPNNSVFVAIIRDPTSHFISASSYYGFINYLSKKHKSNNTNSGVLLENFLKEFLEDGEKYNPGLAYVNNRQSFDFGLHPNLFRNKDIVHRYVQKLDSEFAVVMLMERFDESLVLMKRYLCWDLREILYVPLNINKNRRKNPIIIKPSGEKYLRYFNYADFLLYDHFKKRFLEQIKIEGTDFQEEVQVFQEIKQNVASYCLQKIKSADEIQIEKTKWNSKFNVTVEDCKEMTLPEIPMMRMLIDAANARYKDWLEILQHEKSYS